MRARNAGMYASKHPNNLFRARPVGEGPTRDSAIISDRNGTGRSLCGLEKPSDARSFGDRFGPRWFTPVCRAGTLFDTLVSIPKN